MAWAASPVVGSGWMVLFHGRKEGRRRKQWGMAVGGGIDASPVEDVASMALVVRGWWLRQALLKKCFTIHEKGRGPTTMANDGPFGLP